MKKLFILTISLMLLNCSKDDNNSNDIINKTFLENYAGTSWQEDFEIPTYRRFIGNPEKILETWVNNIFQTDCYLYSPSFNEYQFKTIIENDGDVLKIDWGSWDSGYKGTYTFTVSGNTMKFEDNYQNVYDVNDSGINVINYTKTSIDLDALTKCD